jgi:hypothetical protein
MLDQLDAGNFVAAATLEQQAIPQKLNVSRHHFPTVGARIADSDSVRHRESKSEATGHRNVAPFSPVKRLALWTCYEVPIWGITIKQESLSPGLRHTPYTA